MPTNPPSTHSSKNPSNKNNPNTVTPNLFKPKPNTTSSLPPQPKKKIVTISPTKKQSIPLVGEQQAFAQRQQQERQQRTQNTPSKIEKKQNGFPNPSQLQTLLEPFSPASHELAIADKQKERKTNYQANEILISASDKQKEWEAIHQQLVADELLISAEDKQKKWETSHQPVVANGPLVSTADNSALQLNTAENQQQDQASKNFLEKNAQQLTNFYLREKEKTAKKELSKYLPPELSNRLILASDTIYPPVLQEPIEQQPGYTESQPNDLPTNKPNVFFDQISTEIDKFFSDPTHGAELVREAQQQVQELLDQKKFNKITRSQEEKEVIQKKASDLIELLLDLLENFNDQLNDLNSQKKSLEACNRISSPNDKIENTKKNIEITEKAFCQLCYAFDITEIDLKSSTSLVTPAVIEKALEKTLSLGPSKEITKVLKEITKVLTGRRPAPKTPEDNFKPAAEKVLDLIYKYKTIKPLKKRTSKKKIPNFFEKYITKTFTAYSDNVFFKIITGSEPDLSRQSEFESTGKALEVVDIYFQKPSTEPKHFREAGLYLLKQIELLKGSEKYRYRALQNAFILDSDPSPESFELLKKQQHHKNNLTLLREARTRLKAHLQPTAQELKACYILTYSTSPTEDEAITDSSDEEQNYSRTTTQQRQDDLGEAITTGFKYLTQKYIKSKLKGLNSLFKQDALKKANKAAKEEAGVYELATADSKYIGQSKNTKLRINSRLAKDEKLQSADIKNVIRYDMPGSTKLEREVYAQFLINKYKQQQTTKLLNPRDLIGGCRTETYNRTIEEVITKYNLPK